MRNHVEYRMTSVGDICRIGSTEDRCAAKGKQARHILCDGIGWEQRLRNGG